MKLTKIPLSGMVIIQPDVIKDIRGSFSEAYKLSEFLKVGIKENFSQENWSISAKNVIRGLHYQKEPYAQAKLVQCTHGKVFDVAVDLRPKSKTYGTNFCIELCEDNGLMVYIPEGFAHGFCSLKEDSKLVYRCSNEYSPKHEAGYRWDDPTLDIFWPIENPIVSKKDQALPYFR